MAEVNYLPRLRKVLEKLETVKATQTLEKECAERTIKCLEDNLEASEEGAEAMEKDRDELLETGNRP
ncbi:MAG: hypothetical protein IH897_13220, partial [Planctomycetes bacterium]|nr:hypothetical protein [Planctomycetota bacterium]